MVQGGFTMATLPITIVKHAIMKLDSVQTDMQEIREEESVSDKDRETVVQIAEMASVMEATLLNMIRSELDDEEEFLNEQVLLNDLDEYPENTNDILDTELV